MTHPQKEPLLFDCEGSTLVGIVHRPVQVKNVGLITVVAGGPQYRAGVGRGLVEMGDALAEQGFPVLRFDYRGMGDSDGVFQGFEHIGADLASAVKAFRSAVPELEHIVLWGGCDAASGILIHAHTLERVVAIAVGNPWVSSRETQAAVVRRHYLQRLGQASFWLKLLRGEYQLMGYARSAASALGSRLGTSGGGGGAARSEGARPAQQAQGSFMDRMRRGLDAFDGPVLLLMSGRSLISREFDALVQQQPAWQAVTERKITAREVLPDADQAFSSRSARKTVTQLLGNWLETVAARSAGG
ncbi:hydrolase 1, exosortase A system-associated [Parahaliea mediterranea]|uniref:hydrolase 1, exosortase A system-associated n=1 Tax=Parahaliea mediterranea TaxID=651086 RepID=UPI000E2FEB5D|nr:hydrolase 1, exosortase A system-associated [Parahaliea mediterranea]